MLLILMLTSKGMAGVPRASLVVIAATLNQFGIPEAGLLLILGVDTFLDMGRSATNAVGNSIASAVVAKWEGALVPEAEAEANARSARRQPRAAARPCLRRPPCGARATAAWRWRRPLAALLLLTGAALARAQTDPAQLTGTLAKVRDTGTITIGHRESSIPFSYLSARGEPIGYSIDLCKLLVDAISEEVGRTIAIKWQPVTLGVAHRGRRSPARSIWSAARPPATSSARSR